MLRLVALYNMVCAVPPATRITKRVICDIRKKLEAEAGVELEVAVKLYTPSGYLFEATPPHTNLPSNMVLANNVFENLHTAIAIK